MEGTAEAAHIATRLRAKGVHRAEFAPATPLDFDANCAFVYHFSSRAAENLLCDSPLGSGRIRFTGDWPDSEGLPRFSVALDRVPAQAGLDALRTVRGNLNPSLEAKGSISGTISYAATAPERFAEQYPTPIPSWLKKHPGKGPPAPANPLTGSFTVEGFQLSGASLTEPIRIPKVVFEPMPSPGPDADGIQSRQIATAVTFPAGGTAPLVIHTSLSLSGYLLTAHGQASIARARELARVAGLPDASALDAVAGDPISVDLTAAGPWRPAEKLPVNALPSAGPTAAPETPIAGAAPFADSLSGTVTLRNANWKADFLANHVEISQATLHLGGETRWDTVEFTYGPVKGIASLTLQPPCDAADACPPKFHIAFGALDSATLQSAVLGAQARSTLLASLLERLRPSSSPPWPRLEGTVTAESLLLGPVSLREVAATVRILNNGAEITALDAGLLGGQVHGTGAFQAVGTDRSKPSYVLEAQFDKLSTPAVGQLLGERWSSGGFDAHGKIDLAGFTEKELAASAKGNLHFEWRHGAVAGSVPAALGRFDRWTGDAKIADGALTLQKNLLRRSGRDAKIEAAITFGAPPKVAFAAPGEARAKR